MNWVGRLHNSVHSKTHEVDMSSQMRSLAQDHSEEVAELSGSTALLSAEDVGQKKTGRGRRTDGGCGPPSARVTREAPSQELRPERGWEAAVEIWGRHSSRGTGKCTGSEIETGRPVGLGRSGPGGGQEAKCWEQVLLQTVVRRL